MPTYRYIISPIEHGLISDYPSLHTPHGFSPDILNMKVDQHSIKNRFGLGTTDRDLDTGVDILNIVLYQTKAGTRYTLYLTDTNFYQKETGTNKTWSYKTETYTTGTVTDITGATVTGSSTSWDSSGLAAGDKFILDTDHTADEEISGGDADWATIQTVDNATQITLDASYTGTTGGMSETYKGRMVYSMPSNERWSYAVVDDKFCFSNGNVDVQTWAGSNYASALDSSNAIKARYLIEYANRLIIADHGTTRDPLTLTTSDEGDPTAWGGVTAASYTFFESDDYITGLGKVASYLIVFKRESVLIGNRTGVSSDPIRFPTQKLGIGCIAPYSIVHAHGTVMFLGNNDFYFMDANQPRQISRNKVRYKFFDIVNPTEAQNTWGFNNYLENEVQWIANTTNGKYAFVLNLNNDEWSIFQYAQDMVSAGKGAQ